MPVSELSKHFHPNLFNNNLKASNKEQVLEELLDLFTNEKLVKNKSLVLEMLKQRETLGSTGIGNGIAIPHGRTTAAGDVIIAFGHSEKGIEFEAIDNKPVHLFFMVIAPPNDEGNVYLPALGSLVTVLKKKENREKLKKISSYEELIEIIDGETNDE